MTYSFQQYITHCRQQKGMSGTNIFNWGEPYNIYNIIYIFKWAETKDRSHMFRWSSTILWCSNYYNYIDFFKKKYCVLRCL